MAKDFVTIQLAMLRCTNCLRVATKLECGFTEYQCCSTMNLQPWEWPKTAFTGIFRVD